MAMPTKSRLLTTTDDRSGSAKPTPPIHPGEILLEEFLKPLEITQYRLAKSINVPARRINEIVHGLRGITADTALRLARFFGTTDRFWLNLQTHYDLEKRKDALGRRLDEEVRASWETAWWVSLSTLVRPAEGGIDLRVKVVPRASRSEVVGVLGDWLKVRCAAPAEGGRANRDLTRLLREWLGAQSVWIVSGHSSPKKTVRVEGISKAGRERLLAEKS